MYGRPQGSDYVVYPSVKEEYASINFAFNPNILKRGILKFKSAYKINIKSFIHVKNKHTVQAVWKIDEAFNSCDGINLSKVKKENIPLDIVEAFFKE